MSGKLYIVATPIGNLGDITLRAIETLKSVDVIACEDTRVTSKLLARHEIKKTLISYHQHSKAGRIDEIVRRLLAGDDIALVSDAGTPGMSDPGKSLIEKAIKEDIEIVPVPGPSTLATILSVSAFNLHEFVFLGFMPSKKGRQTKLKEIAGEKRPVILFESVHRIKKLMSELLEFVGDREIEVGRELTKKFETIYRGKISEVKDKIVEKGEFVVIIEGKND
ncbi:MAG: 16S rRNA (cytidine(1402)-2'-O)-methyltransferase [Patescibacteria group bacterium]|nr:16S rRNA (cytidine(1402)-2'-O)-methyltransferase [Patescibacteria group bacterium]